MPFCSKCGFQVGDADAYCGRCGSPQPVPGAPPPPPRPPRPQSVPPPDPLAGINPRTAAILCYLPGLGWIAAIVVLASQRFRHDRQIRFHAFQGLYLFVAWLMADWVFKPMTSWMMPHMNLGSLAQVVLFIMSIFMMVKASHNETYSLPLFGELAQRSVVED
jgi:uncharacterized membrane protein